MNAWKRVVSAGALSAALAAIYLARLAGRDDAASAWRKAHAPLTGVNLGGWLVLERWLTDHGLCSLKHVPIRSPFEGSNAQCERSLTRELRSRGELQRLAQFRDEYVTEADLKAMAAAGVDSVRVPFGFWIALDDEAEAEAYGYLRGRGLAYLDDAMRWAEAAGLKVILDLHGAPGGQSGSQTSGSQSSGWQPSDFDDELALRVVRTVSERYCRSPSLIGVELLNEPELPYARLLPFYRRAYDAVRAAGCEAERVAVIVNPYPVPNVLLHGWRLYWEMGPGGYPNVVYDVHLYYAFLPPGLHALLSLHTLTGLFVDLQTLVLALCGRHSLVGEWSLKLPFEGPLGARYNALTDTQAEALQTCFARRQLTAMGRRRPGCVGHMFWTWNAPDHQAPWSLGTALRRGWLGLGGTPP
jgi:glucan 1,3-beta-glucosidase